MDCGSCLFKSCDNENLDQYNELEEIDNKKPKKNQLQISLNAPIRHERMDKKIKKKKNEFITAKWLSYTILVIVIGLDAINLYSQVSYVPAYYGQIIDSNGFIHSIIYSQSNDGKDDFRSSIYSNFRYHVLETMCPYKMNDECLDDICIHDFRDKKKN